MKLMSLLLIFFVLEFFTGNTPWQLARKAMQQDLKGLIDDAEVNYRRALTLQPDFHEARFNLANNLYRQERFEEALYQFQQIVHDSAVPTDLKAKALSNIGTSYLKVGNLKKSKLALQESLKLNPSDTVSIYNLTYINLLLSKNNKVEPEEEVTNKDGSHEASKEESSRSSDSGSQNDTRSKQDTEELQQESYTQILDALNLSEQIIYEKIKRKNYSGSKFKVEKDW